MSRVKPKQKLVISIAIEMIVGRQVEWGPFNVTRHSIIEVIALVLQPSGDLFREPKGLLRCLS